MAPMEISATGIRGGPDLRRPDPPRPAATSAASRPSLDIVAGWGVERRAWFDLNGDGRIDNTSAMLGGDGYLIGDGDGDGRLATGQETWYDGRGRPVPPPAPAAGEVSHPPPATPPPRADQARALASDVYSRF
jgi:hypothetical protein